MDDSRTKLDIGVRLPTSNSGIAAPGTGYGRTSQMKPTLLITKLRQPSIPAKCIRRPHLIQRLNEGLVAGRRMTLISAPAGFGKSLCAAEWASRLALPVAWLSLDRMDD